MQVSFQSHFPWKAGWWFWPWPRSMSAVGWMLSAAVPPTAVPTGTALPSSCHTTRLLGLGDAIHKFCRFTAELLLMVLKP